MTTDYLGSDQYAPLMRTSILASLIWHSRTDGLYGGAQPVSSIEALAFAR
jgi:hypothetical protein